MKNLLWLILSLNLFFAFSYSTLASDQVIQKNHESETKVKKRKKTKKKKRKQIRKSKVPDPQKNNKTEKRKKTFPQASSKKEKTKKPRPQEQNPIDVKKAIKEKVRKCLDCHEPINSTYSHYGSPFPLCPECMWEYATNSK